MANSMIISEENNLLISGIICHASIFCVTTIVTYSLYIVKDISMTHYLYSVKRPFSMV